eukprot:scaffold10611_cov165-Skeletonema_dohrnii-CCMP3373.AAC.1
MAASDSKYIHILNSSSNEAGRLQGGGDHSDFAPSSQTVIIYASRQLNDGSIPLAIKYVQPN